MSLPLVSLGSVAAVCALLVLTSCGKEPQATTGSTVSHRTVSVPRCDPATIESDLDITYGEDAVTGATSALVAARRYLPDDARLIESATSSGALVVAEKGGRVIAEANVIAIGGDWFVDRVLSCP